MIWLFNETRRYRFCPEALTAVVLINCSRARSHRIRFTLIIGPKGILHGSRIQSVFNSRLIPRCRGLGFKHFPIAGFVARGCHPVARVSAQEHVLVAKALSWKLPSCCQGYNLKATLLPGSLLKTGPCCQGLSFKQINYRYIKNVTLLEITFSLVLAILVVISCFKYRDRF